MTRPEDTTETGAPPSAETGDQHGSTPGTDTPGPDTPSPGTPSPDTPGADTPGAGAPGTDMDLGRTVAELTADDLGPAGRRQLLGRLVGDIRRRGLGKLFRPKAAVRWMADVVTDVAPHVPIRDRATLQVHFPGLDDDELAERLIRNAARGTAGIGAAGGGVAAVEWVATPTLLSAPVLLAAETVGVVAVELKLIGELHEVYGQPITGGRGEQTVALIQSWSGQRGVNPLVPGVGVASILGTAARKELQSTLLKRFGRNLTTLGPLLTGAAVAGYLNRRATRNLGDHVQKDLRKTRRKVIEG